MCVDRVPDRVPVDSVSVEDQDAAQMGVEHLIEKGNRRIAIVTGPVTLKNERRRLQGYRQALQNAGIAMDENLIWQGNLRPDDVAEICRARLAKTHPRPDAIFATNGPTALGVLRALRDSGIQTPADLAVVTFDELTVDDLFSPSITTIVQPAYDIGFRAAEILLNRIEGAEGPPTTIRLPATLKVRESSASRTERLGLRNSQR